MIKNLKKYGNSRALIIEKSLLKAAGLDESAIFQITLNPNGGITIQSVQKDENEKEYKKNRERILKKHAKLFEKLADR